MKNSTQERNQLIARLAGYTAAAGVMVTLAPDANSQVVYSGLQNWPVDPLPEIFDLDMNDDAVVDFNFAAYLYNWSGTTGTMGSLRHVYYKFGYAFVLNGNATTYNSALLNPYTYFPRAFDENVNINAGQSYWWHAAYAPVYYAVLSYGFSYNWTYMTAYGGLYETQYHYGFSVGDFTGAVKYLGVRFHIGPNWHYGWIRINTTTNLGSPIIVDWAYEQTPNKGIITGDKPPQVILNPGVVTTYQETVIVSVIFNEEITGLSVEDFVLDNADAHNLKEWVAGKEFTIEVTANNPGLVTVPLPDGALTDLKGNPNQAALVTYTYEHLVTDINEIADSKFKFYPNPVNGQLNIESETEADISIINMNGRVVLNIENVLQETIDTGNLPKGMYMMKVITDKGVSVHKFVKE